MKSRNPAAEEGDRVEAAWRDALALFPNIAAMKPSLHWMSGLGERTGRDRTVRLRGGRGAQRLNSVLIALTDRELRHFQTLAHVNHEQAVSAMRLNLIVNISGPLGVVVIVNQLLPGRIGQWIIDTGAWFVLGVCLLVGALLFLSMWYAYAGVRQARDLLHLTMIEAGRRGGAPEAAHANEHDAELNASDYY